VCCILIAPKESLCSVIFSDTIVDLCSIIVGDIATAMFEALHLFSETEEGLLLKIFEMINYSSKRAKTLR